MAIKKLIKQFLKFQVVGAVAFVIDYGGLMLLSQACGMDPVIAAAISYIVSTVFNYYASMKFVYTHRDDISKRREFMIFLILSIIGLGLNEVIIWLGTIYLGVDAFSVTASKLVATCIVAVYNFFTRRYFLDADREKSGKQEDARDGQQGHAGQQDAQQDGQ